MRKGIDGLSGMVQALFSMNALNGDVFIFFNRPKNRVKILHWQGDGFIIYHKRLEKGTFECRKTIPLKLLLPANYIMLCIPPVNHVPKVKKKFSYLLFFQ
jgi:hypothetical protein